MMTKLFVGFYYFKALGYYHTIPRASLVIMPLMIATGGVSACLDIYPYEHWFTLSLLILTLISLYFGFLHFWIFPAKWENMDDMQKWQQGVGINQGYLKNNLTAKQWTEWNELNKKYSKI